MDSLTTAIEHLVKASDLGFLPLGGNPLAETLKFLITMSLKLFFRSYTFLSPWVDIFGYETACSGEPVGVAGN